VRFLFLALLLACGPKTPVRGPRVVSLLPSFTEIVKDLGAADRLVACTELGRPGREVKRVAWQDASAAEAILRLHPDLVLRQKPRKQADPLRDALVEAGVEVLSLPSETIQDVRNAIVRIGDALGEGERARRRLERFDAELARAKARGDRGEQPTVLFVIGRDRGAAAGIRAAGPGSFLDELIRYAGGRNALGASYPAYAMVRLERVVRLAPEVIIDNLPAEPDPRTAWEALHDQIPAVRDGRVYAVKDNRLLIPGPGLPRAVARLAEMIHGRP